MRYLTIVVALALVAACSSSDDSTSPERCGDPGVEVTDVWARPTAPGAQNGAVYMTLESAGADALTAASVPATVAGSVEIHETMAADDSGMGDMAMRPIDRLDLPAGQRVVLEPGGYHIMLVGLAAPLDAGSSVELSLRFECADPAHVTASIEDR
jgi:copper(I)-binding protein